MKQYFYSLRKRKKEPWKDVIKITKISTPEALYGATVQEVMEVMWVGVL